MPNVGNRHFSYAKETGENVKYSGGGGIKIRGTGAATKGLRARGPMG